jgi:hypothetical protein
MGKSMNGPDWTDVLTCMRAMETTLDVAICLLIGTGPYAGGLPLTGDIVLTGNTPIDWSESRGCGVKFTWPNASGRSLEATIFNALHSLDAQWGRLLRSEAGKTIKA